ncbi:hypothetical protein MJO28_002917 [Puccinia striiformis f. sp. tritici]|uniref:Uncharacterized protein n=1 Tax=Puccinia striiformis f. sp. tritici TaxID=168172 RepID=A0ACC0ER04_9BASI|nr:hypothetical protein MJO28_002917 [Puccinia striiformis f. sp. tritici]
MALLPHPFKTIHDFFVLRTIFSLSLIFLYISCPRFRTSRGVLSPLRRIVEDSKTNIHMAQLRSVISLVEQTRKLKTTTLFKSSREVSVFGVDSVVWIFSKNFTRARDFLSPEPM